MNITIGSLPLGQWRDLTATELKELQKAVSSSDNSSFIDQNTKEAITEKINLQNSEEIKTSGRRRRGRTT